MTRYMYFPQYNFFFLGNTHSALKSYPPCMDWSASAARGQSSVKMSTQRRVDYD